MRMDRNIKIAFAVFSILLSVIGFSGCRLDEDPPAKNEPFEIVVLSDIHTRVPGNPDDGVYDSLKNLANLMLAVDLINENHGDADFVVVTGDLVGCLFSEDPLDYIGGTDTPPELFKFQMDHLTLPYYVALGNHDYQIGFDPVLGEHLPSLNPDAVEAVWKTVLDTEPYHAFVHKGVQMIFLNSNRGSTQWEVCAGLTTETLCMGSFDREQMDWLEIRLNRPEPSIIFCHHPPFRNLGEDVFFLISYLNRTMTIDNEDRFYETLSSHKDKILAMFVGHWHLRQTYTLLDSIPVYHTGAIGDLLGAGDNISVVRIDPHLETVEVRRYPLD